MLVRTPHLYILGQEVAGLALSKVRATISTKIKDGYKVVQVPVERDLLDVMLCCLALLTPDRCHGRRFP